MLRQSYFLRKDMFTVTPNLLENPKLLVYYLKMVAYTIIPDYIVPVIKQGVEDGSIVTDYPEELADVIMFLTDVWVNPVIFKMSDQQLDIVNISLHFFLKDV